VSSTVHQARESLGHRLRDIRKDAGLTGRQLADLAGWHSSKVSKIEYGRQTPSENDIRIWCDFSTGTDQVEDLIATVRHIEAMYVEWRRMLRTGTKRRQDASITLEADTRLFRWYEPVILPGILHTPDYARAILSRVVDFYRVPDDVDEGVASRMARQQVLYHGDHRFHFIVAEQALRTVVGSRHVMLGQLDRVLTVAGLSRVSFGVIALDSPYRVPTNQFCMFDDRLVTVETVSAELSVTQPREVALYAKAFDGLTKVAKYGKAAKALLHTAIEAFRAA
jgi:transcriptional regulator with XRE-family HTH domain